MTVNDIKRAMDTAMEVRTKALQKDEQHLADKAGEVIRYYQGLIIQAQIRDALERIADRFAGRDDY